MQNEFPNARNVCYLNTGSEGILPQRSLKALTAAAMAKQQPQTLGDHHYYEMPQRCRKLPAQMIHCDSGEIALIGSTTLGMGLLAHSLPLVSGDEVLLVEKDFPANNFAWEPLRRNGVQIRMVPFRPEADQTARLLESISPSTRVISISMIHFYSGFRYDIKAISDVCRQKGIFFVMDAIQAVGAVEINLQETPVDALCAAAHKWQISPAGTGFLYINRNLMPQLRESFSGWMHNRNATCFAETRMFDYAPADAPWRFELGTLPFILFSAYEQSLTLLMEARIPYIEEHNIKLASQLNDFFVETGWILPRPKPSSPFCSVYPPGKYNAATLQRALHSREVYVSMRENYLRITPHFYNTDQDIARFCDEMKKLL